MIVREAVVAGRFYEAGRGACRAQVERLFDEAADLLEGKGGSAPELPERIVGGIVPHAGWAFSGQTAALTLEAIARSRPDGPAVFVLFGAMHRPGGTEGRLFDRGVWQTPLGEVAVDERLAGRILENSGVIQADTAAHESEHSLEVQVPLIQFRFPQAKIVPILVPPVDGADQIGLTVGRTLDLFDVDAVVIGSTDLTHYGPGYGFTPMGVGAEALRWAKEVNDAGVIEAIRKADPQGVVAETSARQSACGGGAVAATLAAARKLGATRGVVLQHVTSNEVLRSRFNEASSDAVGYLSAVLG